MKKLIIPIGILLISHSAYAQLSTTENYIQSKTYLDYNGTTPSKTSETVQYFDGLGRPKQIVNVKASPQGKDVAIHIEYDQFGRQSKDYLPVPQSGTLNGGIIPNPLSNATNSPYGSEKIYSEKILEKSPLDRIQQQIQVGNDWSAKPVKFGYEANQYEEVYLFITTTTWEKGATKSAVSLSPAVVYAPGTLYKNAVTDEDGNQTIEFKNGKGQVLLVRKVTDLGYVDTYYVYNEYDQLAFVIPPNAIHKSVSETLLNDLCYQYRYDARGRLVEKKLPGKGWEYMLYDKKDRLVSIQDANLRAKGHWLYTQYDQFGRVAITGICANQGDGSRQGEQSVADVFDSNNVKRTTRSFFYVQGMDVFYDPNGTYPNGTWVTLLSVNYYDSYPAYGFNPAFPAVIQGEPTLTGTPSSEGKSTKGLPVMSFVKNIEDDNWTKNYNYYDTKGRVIGTHSINHLGGYTKTESKLDFAGVAQTVFTRHKRLETDPERVITETFDYDHQNRLLVHKHQVDANPVEILTQNKYNELSQLESKKIGGITAGSPLQQIDYKYNIRDWMTKVNDPGNLNGKLFGYEIKYNNPLNSAKSPGRFNGNIAEIDWRNSSEDILKRYNYEYDPLNRLKNGFYSEPNATNPANGNFDEYLTYDPNGNITTLKRKAIPVSGGTSTLVDNLEYKYTGNRLNQVIETAMNDTGYEGGNNLIDYDANGNMISMKDKNINSIGYNYLNLPNQLFINQKFSGWNHNTDITHLYRADGTKLRTTKYSARDGDIGDTTITDYLDGFQYRYYDNGLMGGPLLLDKTSFAYEDQAYTKIGSMFPSKPKWQLDFVPTAEGFYSFTENRYIYHYKDHLGNTRISFAKNSTGVLEVTDTNNYYPFGLNHIGGIKGQLGSYKNYKYNGKELQETGMYDYGARFYMPDIGRWGVVDPLAETSRRWSPYTYAFNNPIRFIDPDGRQNEDWFKNSLGQMEFKDDIKSQKDLNDKGIKGSYVGEIAQQGNLNYAANGVIYDESAGGKPIADGRVYDVGEVKITPKGVIAERNLQAARTRLGAAESAMFGKYALGITFGGSFAQSSGSLTLAYNLGTGQANLFGTYGEQDLPSIGMGFQFNTMNAFGTNSDGSKFTDVFGGMEGESTAYSASYIGGGEYSESTKNGQPVEYGTAARSVNLEVGYGIGKARTHTMSISNWMKAHPQYFKIGKSPQLD